MSDCEHIEQLSGADGELKKTAGLCVNMNDGLTSALTQLLPGGADELNSIDADCNTCKHLQRLPFERKERTPSIWGMPGLCGKNGRPVIAWGNGQFIGASCWESRVSDRKSVHAPGNPFDGEQFAKGPHWGLKRKAEV